MNNEVRLFSHILLVQLEVKHGVELHLTWQYAICGQEHCPAKTKQVLTSFRVYSPKFFSRRVVSSSSQQ